MFDLTLTFDNGPEPDVTPRVLDILKAHDIKTTFFVIGEKLVDPARRRLAVRAHDEGHWIGNHTFTHTVPLGRQRDPGTAEREIGRTQTAIGDLAHPSRWFRPFGGGGHLDDRLLKPSVVDHLVRNRHSCVLWNAIPRDWADPEGWVGTALAQLARHYWTLMVLHDVRRDAMRHLDRFLAEVKERGGRLRQDFPASCLPITCGRITGPLADFVSSASERSSDGTAPLGSHEP